MDGLAQAGEVALGRRQITDEDKKLADQLVADLTEWQKVVGTAEITATSMANGAKELLDEVATGKVTGEEEAFSHTDLVDFNANVEGALKAYELLKPVVAEKDAELAKTLDQEFAALEHPARQVQPGRYLDLLRQGRPTPSAGLLGRRQRPGRAALQARRRDRRQLSPRQLLKENAVFATT
ncbi:hypothetical protein GCM10020229_57810 [Kitasatospora albolonga]